MDVTASVPVGRDESADIPLESDANTIVEKRGMSISTHKNTHSAFVILRPLLCIRFLLSFSVLGYGNYCFCVLNISAKLRPQLGSIYKENKVVFCVFVKICIQG